MSTILHDADGHRCIVFNDLVRGDDGVQANQFLIIDGNDSALIDPGGALLYNPLILAMGQYVAPKALTWVLCSHQDPDIVGSIDKWLLYSEATVVCSELWGRFVPHLVPGYMGNTGRDRYHLLPDRGGRIRLGRSELHALPAHFLHSVGNFSFYDPASRILFSGDVGSSLVPSRVPYAFVTDFASHRGSMEGFHRRYMGSKRAARLWVDMVRELDPLMVVPQHGLPFRGEQIGQMLDWLYHLDCGIDLLGAQDYRAPA